jgi:arylsulfatase
MTSWSRRKVLQTAGAAGLVGCGGPGRVRVPGETPTTPTTPTVRPPNIVYLYSDQQRASALGCFGQPLALTPNLDGLADRAIKCVNMFTNSPLCRPARVSMMTGRMAHIHGTWNNQAGTDPKGPSHVRRMRDEAGYLTALIGKGHITDRVGHTLDPANVALLGDWGFEDTFELVSQSECSWQDNPYSDWLLENTPSGEDSKAQRYDDYVAAWELLGFQAPDLPPYDLGTSDHVDLWCGDLAADWIRGYADERPFYLQVNFPGPHSPYDAPTEFRELYDATAPGFPTAILGPPALPVSSGVAWLWDERPELHGLTAAQSRDLYLTYLAKVTLVDRAVGAVLRALEERGLLEDTWIVCGSDHGDLLGDHELWGKVAMFEGAVRTPLVVRPPGGVDPWTAEGLIDQVDVTASILQIAGLVPDGSGSGRLEQWLAGAQATGAQDGKGAVMAEVAVRRSGSLKSAMLRREDWKLVYDIDNDLPCELYDLRGDPEERVNLVLLPEHAATVSDMLDELVSTMEAEKATFL